MTAAETCFSYPNQALVYEELTPPFEKPLKIALLGYRSHPFVGGQGIYLKYVSRALAALGHRVDVYSGPPYPELDSQVKLIKVPSLDLFAQQSHIRALRFIHLASFTDFFEWWTMASGGFAEPYTFGRRVARLLEGSDYDVIHDNQSLCYGLTALQNQGFRVVSTIHHPIHRDREIALQATKKWSDRLLIKRWYSFLSMQENVVKQLDHVITVSRASQKDIATYFAKPGTSVIPNGIDTNTFRPLDNIVRKPYRIITTASSDQPLKGLQFLLKAIAQLKNEYPKIHLQVIGKLKNGGDTEKQLQALELQNHVSFSAGISTEQLVQHYAHASIAVCPSLYEGFGLPAAEAMACELPVVASRGGALPEVMGDAGRMVPAGNSEALANHIKLLFDSPEQACLLGKKARRHVENNFSWLKVATTLTQYYRAMIANAHY